MDEYWPAWAGGPDTSISIPNIFQSGREEELKTHLLRVKLKRLNIEKLLRTLTTNHMRRTLHKMPLQLGLILKVNPTLPTVKVLPGIGRAIPSKLVVMQSPCTQKLDITLLAIKTVTGLPAENPTPIPR